MTATNEQGVQVSPTADSKPDPKESPSKGTAKNKDTSGPVDHPDADGTNTGEGNSSHEAKVNAPNFSLSGKPFDKVLEEQNKTGVERDGAGRELKNK